MGVAPLTKSGKKFDYVIVGGGTAGCVMAARLSEQPGTQVLLIEAGPDYDDLEKLPAILKYSAYMFRGVLPGQHNWQFRGYVGDEKKRAINIPRGRVTGGSSAIHGQVFLRGIREDYDAWAAWGNTEWSFEKVLPYFNKCESDAGFPGQYHGSSGPMLVTRVTKTTCSPATLSFYRACSLEGFVEDPDHNHPDSTGFGPRPLNNKDGVRISTAMGYLNPARGRPNLSIVSGALVRRIRLEGKRAVAVETERAGQLDSFEGAEIILCAGAIGSPQLLQLSGIGAASDLLPHDIPVVHELPGVGQHVQDHPIAYLMFQCKGDANEFHKPLNQAQLRTTTTGSPQRNDIQIHLMVLPGGPQLPALARMARRRGVSWSSLFKSMLRFVFRGERSMFGYTIGLEFSQSSGEMRIKSADPREKPFINFRYVSHPEDRARMRFAVRLAARLWERAVESGVDGAPMIMVPKKALESDELLDAWVYEHVETQHHICGTCKMGPPTDQGAVVDQYCRVRGLTGLRIVDASVFPSVVSANPNATTIMIAERVADFVKAGL